MSMSKGFFRKMSTYNEQDEPCLKVHFTMDLNILQYATVKDTLYKRPSILDSQRLRYLFKTMTDNKI